MEVTRSGKGKKTIISLLQHSFKLSLTSSEAVLREACLYRPQRTRLTASILCSDHLSSIGEAIYSPWRQGRPFVSPPGGRGSRHAEYHEQIGPASMTNRINQAAISSRAQSD